MSVRLRRLQAEFERISQLFANHERIRILESFGTPPERYVIEYRLTGLVEEQGEIKERGLHRAQIVLGRNYPRELPRCSMLTPVFHPNIDHLRICTEDIGSAGKTIDQVITFIGEMIAYQTYNVKSPLNGDAARWTIEHLDQLPLEKIDLTPKETLSPQIRMERAALSPAAPEMQTTIDIPIEQAQAVQSPPATTQVRERCGNCGQTGPEVLLDPCVNSHVVCEDCSLACQACANTVCVLCDLRNCANCHGLVCSACQVTCGAAHRVCRDCSFACASCGKPVCVLCELRNCAACQALICSDCLVLCAGCQRPFCSGHVHRCQICNSLKCSDCMIGCERCGNPCCAEHVNSKGICTVCDSTPTSTPTLEAENKVTPDQANAPARELDLEETTTDASAQELRDEVHPEQRDVDSLWNARLDTSLEIVNSADDRSGMGFAKRAANNELPTDSLFGNLGLMTLPLATVTAVEAAREDRFSGLRTIEVPDPVSSRPSFSISREDVRMIPETALYVPLSIVQVSPVEKRRMSGKAIAAFVFGMLGIPLMGILVGPVAVFFGAWALHEIGQASYLTGRPLAVTGVVLGIFDIILWSGLFLIWTRLS